MIAIERKFRGIERRETTWAGGREDECKIEEHRVLLQQSLSFLSPNRTHQQLPRRRGPQGRGRRTRSAWWIEKSGVWGGAEEREELEAKGAVTESEEGLGFFF